jgi:ketosteroid isomerase-like protein/quinol monooxygenase YgiN
MTENNHTVSAVFTFKNAESKSKFINFCNGEKGLGVTRSWPGCKSIECYEVSDNTNKIIIWQKWENKESHESYVKHRHDEGSFNMLGEWVEGPPEISALVPVNFESDEETIRNIVNDMCNVDYKVGYKHMHDDCVFIRPSGNPLNKKGWEEMMTNDNVVVESNDLVSVNKLQIEGEMAYVCYTSHGKFSYKGTANDDIAVFTSILKKCADGWKIVMGQRSTGRGPEESAPQF